VKKLRVYLADDHPVVRNGLRALLDAEPDLEVVGEAYDGEGAVRGAREHRPDVVVMDVSMPGVGGAAATERIRADCPAVRVVALTAHEDRGYLRRLLDAGAAGYVLKRSAAEDLVRAVRCVAAGEVYLDPDVAGQVAAAVGRPGGGAAARLSDQEEKVLRRIALGHLVKQIAADLEVTVRTIETYKARGMEKLGLRTRADVVRYAVQHGWLTGG